MLSYCLSIPSVFLAVYIKECSSLFLCSNKKAVENARPHVVSGIIIKMKKISIYQNEKALSSFKQRMPYANPSCP